MPGPPPVVCGANRSIDRGEAGKKGRTRDETQILLPSGLRGPILRSRGAEASVAGEPDHQAELKEQKYERSNNRQVAATSTAAESNLTHSPFVWFDFASAYH
jgi:hypothetical protein